jgi:uncharacterized membrane protein YjgN (DUF898 family)
MEKLEKNFNISISGGTIVKALVIFVVAFLLYKMLDLVLVVLTAVIIDRKSTRLNSSHSDRSRMPSSA